MCSTELARRGLDPAAVPVWGIAVQTDGHAVRHESQRRVVDLQLNLCQVGNISLQVGAQRSFDLMSRIFGEMIKLES